VTYEKNIFNNRSSMKLMIFISLPHLGHSRGSTTHTFLMHSRQFLDGIFFCFGSDMLRASIALVSPPAISSCFKRPCLRRSPLDLFEYQP
jgi:hypothetical protein